MTTPLEAALGYASRGLPVFPVARDKTPLTQHGFKDASTDAATIREWWRRFPDAGVGIPTGRVSGIVVLDIDPRHGGNESYAAMVGDHGQPPFGPSVKTGGGGRHLYYRHPGGDVGTVHGFRDGLDLQADSAYVIAPPSGHPSGGTYSWTIPLSPGPPLQLLPPWLLKEAADASRKRATGGQARTFDTTPDGMIPEGQHHDWIVAQAASIASRTPGIGEAALLDDMRLWASRRLPDSDRHEQEIRLAVRSAIGKFGRPAPARPAIPPSQAQPPPPLPPQQAPPPSPAPLTFPGDLFYQDDKGEKRASFPAFVGWFRREDIFVVPIERGTFSSPGQFELLRYEGGYYNGKARSFIRGRVEDAFRSASLASRDAFREEVVKGIGATSEFHRSRADFNPPGRLCLENGVLDIERGAVDPHAPSTVFTWKMPVAYDPAARCPRFVQFLSEVMPDEAKRALLVDLMGYCLWRRNPLQLFFVNLGDGANGKTTFTRVLQALLGKDAVSALDLSAISEDKFTRAELEGRLVNLSDDLPHDRALRATGVIKVLTGEGAMLVQRKYQAPFQLDFGGKLIANANRTPETKDDTYAFWRRAVVFDWQETFPVGDPRRDPLLFDKLVAELPGILNLALAGLRRVQSRTQFDPHGVLKDAEEEWRRRADPIRAELLEDFEAAPGEFVLNSRIQEWHAERSEEAGRETLKDGALGERVTSAFPLSRTKRKMVNGKNVWVRPNLREKPTSRVKPMLDIDLILAKPGNRLPEAENGPEGGAPPASAISPSADTPPTSRGSPGGSSMDKVGQTGELREQRVDPETPASSPPSAGGPDEVPPEVPDPVMEEATSRAEAAVRNELGKLGDLAANVDYIKSVVVSKGHDPDRVGVAFARLYGDGYIWRRPADPEGTCRYRPGGPPKPQAV